jgi:hypothetical protein
LRRNLAFSSPRSVLVALLKEVGGMMEISGLKQLSGIFQPFQEVPACDSVTGGCQGLRPGRRNGTAHRTNERDY